MLMWQQDMHRGQDRVRQDSGHTADGMREGAQLTVNCLQPAPGGGNSRGAVRGQFGEAGVQGAQATSGCSSSNKSTRCSHVNSRAQAFRDSATSKAGQAQRASKQGTAGEGACVPSRRRPSSVTGQADTLSTCTRQAGGSGGQSHYSAVRRGGVPSGQACNIPTCLRHTADGPSDLLHIGFAFVLGPMSSCSPYVDCLARLTATVPNTAVKANKRVASSCSSEGSHLQWP